MLNAMESFNDRALASAQGSLKVFLHECTIVTNPNSSVLSNLHDANIVGHLRDMHATSISHCIGQLFVSPNVQLIVVCPDFSRVVCYRLSMADWLGVRTGCFCVRFRVCYAIHVLCFCLSLCVSLLAPSLYLLLFVFLSLAFSFSLPPSFSVSFSLLSFSPGHFSNLVYPSRNNLYFIHVSS